MKKVIGLIILAILMITSFVVAKTPEEAFDQGYQFYVEGKFEEAYQAFTEATRHGVQDPILEFNLGNASFKTGRLAEAVLHYARAVKWDPSDEDARRNLNLVQSFLDESATAAQESGSAPGFVRFLDQIGPDRLLWVNVVIFWLILTLITLVASGIKPFKAWMGWTASMLILVFLLSGLAWGLTLHRLEGKDEAVVMSPTVEVLAGPGRPNATLFTIYEGFLVERRSRQGEWVQIRLPNGIGGWVLNADLEPL